MNGACKGCADIKLWSTDAACLWLRLLKPTQDIQQQAQKHLQVRPAGRGAWLTARHRPQTGFADGGARLRVLGSGEPQPRFGRCCRT